jgi:hypothetical protein
MGKNDNLPQIICNLGAIILYDSSLQSVSKPSANALSWFGTTMSAQSLFGGVGCMMCHRIDIIAMCNKGSFSHVILLPCQTGCYGNCIFVETSLLAPEWGETCHHGDARKTPLFFTGEKSFAGGRTFKMSKSGNGHLHRIIDFH